MAIASGASVARLGRGRRGRAAAVMMMMTETVTTTRGAMDERCAMGSDA